MSLAETFSILYRIEWVETEELWAMTPVQVSFSILYRIEWVETSEETKTKMSAAHTFSILYRIEWVETC